MSNCFLLFPTVGEPFIDRPPRVRPQPGNSVAGKYGRSRLECGFSCSSAPEARRNQKGGQLQIQFRNADDGVPARISSQFFVRTPCPA
jgi:hypothetical protein